MPQLCQIDPCGSQKQNVSMKLCINLCSVIKHVIPLEVLLIIQIIYIYIFFNLFRFGHF